MADVQNCAELRRFEDPPGGLSSLTRVFETILQSEGSGPG
jgi:hypothetical protein